MIGDYENEIQYQCDHDFYFYDDLGSMGKASTDFREKVRFSLIDKRYESRKMTLITTNLDKSEMPEMIGQRGMSRLYAKENCIIDCRGSSDLRKLGL